MLMIVEKELDVDSIEKSGLYDGLYFILGGHLPYIADNPRDYINVEELAKLIIEKIKSETLEEIIFALPVNEEGDNEMEYLKGILKQIVGIESIKITHLARGVSTGLEMEYVDKDTFRNAFTLRNPD
jgi:recombination protein RecR